MEESRTKYKVGDRCTIINYGSTFWSSTPINSLRFKQIIDKNRSKTFVYDMSPELVGQKVVITHCQQTQGRDTYVAEGVSKTAWFYNDQLQLTNPLLRLWRSLKDKWNS